jgi:hypothetical protein
MRISRVINNWVHWRKNLQKKTNKELVSLFSDTNRMNIDPQIYAGLLLKERKYDVDELIRIKESLIDALTDKFDKKFGKTDDEIKRENLFKEIFHRVVAGIFIMESVRLFISDLNIPYKDIIPYFAFLLCLTPLLSLKKTNEKAINQVNKKREELNRLIDKLNRELTF